MFEKENKEKSKLSEQIGYTRKNVWEDIDKKTVDKIYTFGEKYKHFLDSCKTERESVKFIIKEAEKAGFTDMNQGMTKAGKYYYNYKGKLAVLIRTVDKPLTEGMKIIASHIDSPRLDLKQNPLYEDNDIAFLKTHYYGGIKKYQWMTRPLAIHGVFALKNGSIKEIVIGEKDDDPVFAIDDLLPHLDAKRREEKVSKAFTGEKLNVMVGSRPLDNKDEDKRFKMAVMEFLNREYGIEESDFQSAEIEIVPAGKARDLGFDRSMITSYGHDDRVCAYTSMRAIQDAEKPSETTVAFFMDKEEIGSTGNTGADSRILEYFVGILLDKMGQTGRPLDVLAHSECLSADVNGAFSPDYPDVYEKTNSSFAGGGVCLTKYTGSRGKAMTNDASAEFTSKIRRIFDDAGVVWQTGELGKVDEGGGGTVAMFFASYGMDVIDCGVPVLSMHAPMEIVSKGDVYNTYLAYKAFFESGK